MGFSTLLIVVISVCVSTLSLASRSVFEKHDGAGIRFSTPNNVVTGSDVNITCYIYPNSTSGWTVFTHHERYAKHLNRNASTIMLHNVTRSSHDEMSFQCFAYDDNKTFIGSAEKRLHVYDKVDLKRCNLSCYIYDILFAYVYCWWCPVVFDNLTHYSIHIHGANSCKRILNTYNCSLEFQQPDPEVLRVTLSGQNSVDSNSITVSFNGSQIVKLPPIQNLRATVINAVQATISFTHVTSINLYSLIARVTLTSRRTHRTFDSVVYRHKTGLEDFQNIHMDQVIDGLRPITLYTVGVSVKRESSNIFSEIRNISFRTLNDVPCDSPAMSVSSFSDLGYGTIASKKRTIYLYWSELESSCSYDSEISYKLVVSANDGNSDLVFTTVSQTRRIDLPTADTYLIRLFALNEIGVSKNATFIDIPSTNSVARLIDNVSADIVDTRTVHVSWIVRASHDSLTRITLHYCKGSVTYIRDNFVAFCDADYTTLEISPSASSYNLDFISNHTGYNFGISAVQTSGVSSGIIWTPCILRNITGPQMFDLHVSVVRTTKDSVMIKWMNTGCMMSDGVFFNYTIAYYIHGEQDGCDDGDQLTLSHLEQRYTVYNLETDTTYGFCVRVNSPNVIYPWSKPSFYSTKSNPGSVGTIAAISTVFALVIIFILFVIIYRFCTREPHKLPVHMPSILGDGDYDYLSMLNKNDDMDEYDLPPIDNHITTNDSLVESHSPDSELKGFELERATSQNPDDSGNDTLSHQSSINRQPSDSLQYGSLRNLYYSPNQSGCFQSGIKSYFRIFNKFYKPAHRMNYAVNRCPDYITTRVGNDSETSTSIYKGRTEQRETQGKDLDVINEKHTWHDSENGSTITETCSTNFKPNPDQNYSEYIPHNATSVTSPKNDDAKTMNGISVPPYCQIIPSPSRHSPATMQSDYITMDMLSK